VPLMDVRKIVIDPVGQGASDTDPG
jgi:hypothetical protein